MPLGSFANDYLGFVSHSRRIRLTRRSRAHELNGEIVTAFEFLPCRDGPVHAGELVSYGDQSHGLHAREVLAKRIG